MGAPSFPAFFEGKGGNQCPFFLAGSIGVFIQTGDMRVDLSLFPATCPSTFTQTENRRFSRPAGLHSARAPCGHLVELDGDMPAGALSLKFVEQKTVILSERSESKDLHFVKDGGMQAGVS
jgi:hypothetical protein